MSNAEPTKNPGLNSGAREGQAVQLYARLLGAYGKYECDFNDNNHVFTKCIAIKTKTS